MNAVLQWDAPGLSGPEDQPEYDGPSIDELTTQKLGEASFVQAFAVSVPEEVYALLISGNDADFLYRFRYELRLLAEESAREEHATNVRQFEAECEQ